MTDDADDAGAIHEGIEVLRSVIDSTATSDEFTDHGHLMVAEGLALAAKAILVVADELRWLRRP